MFTKACYSFVLLLGILTVSGCSKTYFMDKPPASTEAERKERLSVMDGILKQLKPNDEIVLRTTQGIEIGGRFLEYREGFVSLQTGTTILDYDLNDIEAFKVVSKTNHKRAMIFLMLLVVAYIIFEFTRSTS